MWINISTVKLKQCAQHTWGNKVTILQKSKTLQVEKMKQMKNLAYFNHGWDRKSHMMRV